jgi:predicted nucleotidyltransferase
MNFGLSESALAKFRSVFAKYPEIEEVVIYGSRAKGNHREGSDIDLSIKGVGMTEAIRARVWLDLDNLNTPYLIDLSVYSLLPPGNLKDHISRAGKTFYLRNTE